MKRTTQPPHGKTLLMFAFFVLLVVAVIYLTGWSMWHFTREIISDMLDRHLTAIAMLVSRQLDGEALQRLKPGDESTATFKHLRDELAVHRSTFHLADLYVFDSDYRILCSAALDGPIGTENPALRLDSNEILDAWMGHPVNSSILERGGNMLKTGYAPIYDKSGHVTAILGVETDVRFFDRLALLRNGLFVATGLALACICTLGLFFRRLLTRLLLAEEQNQETHRLALVGRLSAQICHEIRNPLSVISASSEFVIRRMDKLGIVDGKIHELMGYVVGEIERLNAILTRVLDVARRPQLEKKPVKIGELVGPLMELVRPELEKSGVELSAQGENSDVTVMMDPNGMRQVLLNGILNARDAMSEAPRKTLTLSVVRLHEGRVAIRLDDSGTGVPPEIMKDMFEPFVTAKASGNGLGLFVAKRIVDEHEGEIRLESLAGGGTRFVVELPVC